MGNLQINLFRAARALVGPRASLEILDAVPATPLAALRRGSLFVFSPPHAAAGLTAHQLLLLSSKPQLSDATALFVFSNATSSFTVFDCPNTDKPLEATTFAGSLPDLLALVDKCAWPP